MPRLVATVATPAVRQLASAARAISAGVAPLSSDANTSGWSPSNENCWRWESSVPRPENPCTMVRLWVPFTHSQRARHWNWAASGMSVRAWRACRMASTLTPLSRLAVESVAVIVRLLVIQSRWALLGGAYHARRYGRDAWRICGGLREILS